MLYKITTDYYGKDNKYYSVTQYLTGDDMDYELAYKELSDEYKNNIKFIESYTIEQLI